MIAARAMNEMMTMDFVLMGSSQVREQNRIHMIVAGKTHIPRDECHHSFGGDAKDSLCSLQLHPV
jgi:hypothetical protein